MVFESIVVDFLNRILGDYFENLEAKQLNLGIWGGDVHLRDLLLKSSAMDDLGLPFQIVVGKLGTLTMKIPWQSLYTAPVELNLKDLHLLVVPSHSVAYNAEAEEIALQAAKQKEIGRIEEARKKENQPKLEPEADTFAEKLITQIIKNVQIKIESIHIRYEDGTTKPSTPFGFGVMLRSLNVQTTGNDWKPAIITEIVQTIHKLATLEGLSLYWNSDTELLSRSTEDKSVMIDRMRELVENPAAKLTYILGPIASEAKVNLTPSPERGSHPFSLPKAVVDVVMKELALGMTNRQFQDIIELAESMDYMTRAQYNRKYGRPANGYKGHAKEWWKFAYRCIVEEDVRRRKQNWSWENMKRHRNLIKIYSEAYYKKLSAKKPKADVDAQVTHCEKVLDVFNITLVRKQVELRIEREGKRNSTAKKSEGGWFSGWFGGGTPSPEDSSTSGIAQQLEEALTPDEKKKLYSAIDYSENALPLDYPTEYIEYILNFKLLTLKCTVREVAEDKKQAKVEIEKKILEMVISDVTTAISTRPVKNGLKVSVHMGSISASGMQADSKSAIPYLLTTKMGADKNNLFEIDFESNPLNSKAEQKIRVSAQPVEFVYHASTINQLVYCFTLPPEVQLSKIQAATVATLNDWKMQSTTGIQSMIEKKGEVDINIEFLAPYILIPQGGNIDFKNGSVLVLDLGKILVKSKPRAKVERTKEKLDEKQRAERLQEVIEISYDTFLITLSQFQVCMALPGEDYKAILQKGSQPATAKDHLRPLIYSEEFKVQLDQCIVPDDPRLPKLKISASLPLLALDITEHRLLELVKLLVTLPFPKSDPLPDDIAPSALANNPALAQAYAVAQITYTEIEKKRNLDDIVQFTDMVLNFSIEAINLKITRVVGSKLTPLADFAIQNLTMIMTGKTYGTGIDLAVGGLTLCALTHTLPGLQGPLYLLKTPMTEGRDVHLLKLHMFSITPDCPVKFATKVKQHIKADISSLDIILHQEALNTILAFVDGAMVSFNKALETEQPSKEKDAESISNYSFKKDGKKQISRIEATRKAVAKKHIDSKDILVQVEASLDCLTLQLSTTAKNIVKVVLSKLDAGFIQKPKKSVITLDLTELTVLNLDPNCFYQKIMRVEADRVMHVHVTMYEDATKEKNYLDMKKHDMKVRVVTGSPIIVYLSVFVDEIMEFVDKFQAAKEAVMDASAAAAEAAKENVGQVYAASQRILLDVELKAPRIIIPRNKNSPSAILADLGNLTVSNFFKKQEGEDVTNIVIIDEMRVTLENMQMSRIIMDKETQSAYVECLMLDPISFRLEIRRNLSTEWYNEIPSIDIDGNLESCYLRASSEDYDTFMACLLENVSGSPPPPASSTEIGGKPSKSSVKSGGGPLPTITEHSETVVAADVHGDKDDMRVLLPVAQEFQKPYCTMKLNIAIGETGIVMYQGSSKLEGKSGMVEREKKDAFADFSINDISVGLTMWSNDNMNCLVTIAELSLDDCRPGSRAITNLIQRKSTGSDTILTDSAIVRITYRTDAAGGTGTTLNIETTSLTFVLYLEYLLQITGFFTAFSPEPPATKLETGIRVEEFPTANDPLPVREITESKLTPAAGDGSKAAPAEPPFNIYFTMAETEVVLVETLETLDTNSLLLNCSVSMKYVQQGTKTNIMGAVNKVKLSTCTYNPESRVQSLAEVISPMSITIVMNVTEDLATVIDLNISDIFIRLTAGTLELLIKISSGLSATPASEEEIKELKDYSDVWDVKAAEDSNFWFLKPDAIVEVAQDALQVRDTSTGRLFEVAEDLVVKERLVLESGCIVVTFETGVGVNTTPVLLLETDVDLQMFDWSQKLQIAGRLKLEAAYYNAVFGMWEFLVEPVETRHHGKVSHQPWELLFEYSTVEAIPSGSGDGANAVTSYPAISLQSDSLLELTITKTALEVINILKEDFNEAVKALVSQRDVSTSAYTIVNDCGSDIKLDLRGTSFALVRKGVTYDEAFLKNGTQLNLGLIESYDMTKHHTSVLKEQEGRVERLLKVHIEEYGFFSAIPVNRAEKRYYGLSRKTEWSNSINYGILCDTTVRDCSKVVTIRGIVQVTNELSVPVDVYYMDGSGSTLLLAGTVEKHSPLNLPLAAIYTKSCELFFAPKGFTVSTLPYVWTTLMKDLLLNTYLTCKPREPLSGSDSDTHLKVIGEAKQALLEATNRKTLQSQCYHITIKPPLIIDNLLPVSLAFVINGTDRTIVAERGHSVQITNLEIGLKEEFQLVLKMLDYDDQTWASHIKMTKATPELSTWCFQSETHKGNSIYLGVHKEMTEDIITIHVYCPFWMVNRTGLDLGYKAEEKEAPITQHKGGREDPVMFSFRGKAFFSKKKAMVKINERSDWSEKFSLDVAGSAGSVTCKSPLCDYQVGIEIVLSNWGLTKSIIFTPRFFLISQCSYLLFIAEREKPEGKIPLVPSKCIPFWPKSSTASLTASIEGTSETTKAFNYDYLHSTLLSTKNKYGGIHVDIHITEVSTVITFSEYQPGKAPVLIVNYTSNCSIEISEKGVDNVTRVISPGMSQLIAWLDPMGERVLVWAPATSGKKTSYLDKLHGDGSGSFRWTNSSGQDFEYYWVCFLDGLQRVLLFTGDSLLCNYLQSSREIEVPVSDYTVMLHGLGLSLVNNQTFKEVMYMRLASSIVGWESSKPGKKQRFKPLPDRDSDAIEIAYKNYLNEKAITPTAKSHLTLDGGIELDFVDMKMFRPSQKVLRRVFQTGVWIHYKTFPHSTQFHAKFNRLQIDNQLPDCIFHIVLAPVPPPKSVSANSDVPKPFAEVSIMQRMTAHSSVIQFKYFKVLVQEFHIRLDISFVNAIVELFSESGEKKLEHMVEYFDKDYEEACTPLDVFLARHIVSQGQKHFYDFLHFSPLKIHVSFSMGGATQLSNNFLNLLLQSLGVTLTEIQDVVFKLACLELQHMFLSGDQLYAEAYSHYSSQAIKQLYVLVLGLDVIGNPYGLFLGVTEGVEAFFYEPFQGAIQGPGEFAEGLALGVKSLVGHTLGGAAGAMSRITGTLGKGIAALTMDDEYQKKRREDMSKRQDVGEGLASSGKGLVMGFFDGVTGVVTKPFQGAKTGGVEGFFKGLGKGAVGLVARPTAGVVDFTSGTFDAVKKATSVSEEVRRMRPPRHIPTDSILQPYVAHEAEGRQLMNELEKGKFTTTDTYIAHALVNPHGLFVLLLTNKRVFYLKKDEVFGGWGIQWSYIWEDLDGPPDIVEKGLSFKLKARERKFMRSARKTALVPLYSPDVCTWMLSKIETAMKTETGVEPSTSSEHLGK